MPIPVPPIRRAATSKRRTGNEVISAGTCLRNKQGVREDTLFVCLRGPKILPELWSERPAHGSDEAGLIVEHCQAKFFGARGNVNVQRHHHAVIEDLLVGAGVAGPLKI